LYCPRYISIIFDWETMKEYYRLRYFTFYKNGNQLSTIIDFNFVFEVATFPT